MKIKDSRGDRIFNVVIFILGLIAMIFTLYPVLYVVSASFSSPRALITGRVWLWPVEFTLSGYNQVFKNQSIWSGYWNSLIYATAGTLLALILTIMAAYPLSRKDMAGRKGLLMLYSFTMLFSGGMIPGYLLIRNLGLLDTRWAIIIPGSLSVFNVMVTRTFFVTNIPDELLESAKLDGCSDFKFITGIVLPLSGAIVAVMTLYYAVGAWNAYFSSILYLSDRKKYPLQVILREVLVLSQTDQMVDDLAGEEKMFMAEQLKYGLIVVASIPLLVMYPFVQKHFTKGVMIGSIKG